ncbi:MAG: tetratricopeptide repeat protein [candidate division Zixibacteria bacterium]|nr:tetratricopeptide repeat protein [candidate division Zixibacteria bacterium]
MRAFWRQPVPRWVCGGMSLAIVLLWGNAALSQYRGDMPGQPDTVRIQPRAPVSPDIERLQGLTQRLQPPNVVRPELVRGSDLMNAGKFEEALAILLPAWKSDPANDALASALKQAYRGIKDFRGVQSVLQVQLKSRPRELMFASELTETYWQLGLEDSATTVIKQMIATDPKDVDRHHMAAETYVRVGRYPEAIDVYRNARRTIGDSLIFSENLAQLFEARREYSAAVSEYFRWLAMRPDAKQTIQRRITNLVKMPEAVGGITSALKDIVKSSPRNEYGHRLYGDLLFESGSVDSAFAEYNRADQLSAQPGEHLLFGIERALETDQFAVARNHAMEFLKLYPKNPKTTRVNFGLARAELGLGHPDVAVTMLKELATQIPNGPERGQIEYEIGEVYRSHTSLMDSARTHFRVVAAMERATKRAAAMIRLGDLGVYFSDLAGADSSYHDALNARPSPEEAEEAGFRMAELLLFKGEYDSCAGALKALVGRYPRGLFVNDALELKVMITDSKDAMNWSLDRYSGGVYAMRRGWLDSASVLFGQLVSDSASKLAPQGQFEIAQIKALRAQPAEAVQDYRMLISRFGQSSLVPRAWAAIGALYEGPLNDRQQARTAYQTIVTEFRDSPLVEEARLHLQRMDVP